MKSSLRLLYCAQGSPIHPVFVDRGVKSYYWNGSCDEILKDWKNCDLIFLKVRDYAKDKNFYKNFRAYMAKMPQGKCPEIIAVADAFGKRELEALGGARIFDYLDLDPSHTLEERLNLLLKRCEVQGHLRKEYRRLATQANSLKSHNKDLKRLTLTDDLTGLHNTRFMKEIFEELFQLIQRYERPLSVFMMDLDHFKDVNDANDHLIGSTVLKEMGRVLREHTRKSDIQIRYGGDEFVVIMPETPVDSALRVAERVRKTIEEMTMTVTPDFVVKVTASLGVSTFDKSRHSEYWELLREADMAMYSAKKMGRNRVCVFGGEISGYDTAKSSFATVLKQIVDVDAKKKPGLPSDLNRYLRMIKKGVT